MRTPTELKTDFSSGTAATETKFGDLIDSTWNKETNLGLVPGGASGPTHYATFFDETGATPGSTSATGMYGRMQFSAEGIYFYNGATWWFYPAQAVS